MAATELFAVLGVCAVWVAGIAGAVYLTLQGHPVVGVIVLLVAFCVRIKTGKAAEEG